MTDAARSYGRHPGGTPRNERVPATTGICPVHGEVEFRYHRVGKTSGGRIKYRRRCPECHADQANRQRRQRDS